MMKSITLRFFSFITLSLFLLTGPLKAVATTPAPSTGSIVDRVIEEAMKYIGTPYRWGGKTPAGFDCAGFTRYVYSKFGLSLAPSAGPQFKQGTSVKKSELRKGDLVFFGGRKSTRSIGHVGIVTSVEGDAFHFIHAASKGITISSSKEAYYSKRYICACRVIDRISVDGKWEDDDPAIVKQVIVSSVDAQRGTPSNNELGVSVEGSGDALSDTLISIAMVGDMMLGTTYPTHRLPQNDGENLFDEVRSILKGAKISVGNCEGAICEKGKSTKGKGKNSYVFRMPTSYAHLFRDAGFDFLSLANNHSHDFGREGVRETMSMLDSMNIRYAGVKGMCRSTILERDGVKYGFCAFGYNNYTYRHQDVAQVKKILQGLRDSCDILIVSIRGGAEGKDKIHLPIGRESYDGEDRGDLRKFAHLCVDEGADVVFGHGPHVCRAVECYKGRFIAYSLGNFCTPSGFNVSGISGYAPVIVVNVDRKGNLVNGRIHSFIQSSGVGPRKDESNKVAQAIRKLTLSDFKNAHLNIADDGSFVPTK